MIKSLDAYRYQVIDKIMASESETEVKKFIGEAINRLRDNLLGIGIIFHFLDSVKDRIEEFESMDLDGLQLKIVKFAKAECRKQIKTLDFRRLT